MTEPVFPKPGSKSDIETGSVFSPKFDDNGLIVCVASDAETGEIVMLAYMNAQALALTIETGEAHYWSRSRAELWHKGATSGSVQKVIEMRTDCDQDAILIKVSVAGSGASCHLGYHSCFFRSVPLGSPIDPTLELGDCKPLANPAELYKKDK